MFCPYCATETTQGLNYGKRCGGNLAPLTAPQETRGLDAPHLDSLNPAPAHSITEQTTRTLEPVKKR